MSLNFDDLTPIELPFTYQGTDYVLREASEGDMTKWRNNQSARRVYNDKGNLTSMGPVYDAEPELVSYCLFTKNTPVTIAQVNALPFRVGKKLFEEAKRISGISDESSEKKLLLQALALPSSPITLSTLSSYLMALDKEEYADIQEWFAKTTEESAKNSQAGTAAS